MTPPSLVAQLTPPLLALATGIELVWILIWSGLGMLTLALVLLLVTRWGHSRPLRKCIALSVWTHFLLAMYALTVDIVPRPGSPRGTQVQVALAELPQESNQAQNAPAENSERPWEQTVDESFRQQLAGAAPMLDRPDTSAPLERLLQESQPQAAPLAPPIAQDMSLPQPAPLPFTPASTIPGRAPSRAIDSQDGARSNDLTDLAPAQMLPDAAPPQVALRPNFAATSSLSRPTIAPGSREALERLLDLAPSAASGSNIANTPAANPATSPASPLAPRSTTGEYHPPSVYTLRTSPERAQIAQLQGGSVETEAAVSAALRWLAKHQSHDGRWDASQFGAGREARILGQDRGGSGIEADTGITGLALLAFLGAGHTHRTGEHVATVRTAIEYLVRSQGIDGNLGGGADSFAFMYCHGMAGLALSEAYGMTGDEALKRPVQQAISFTISRQHHTTGGWRYRAGETGDLSQLGWQLMMLKSGELAGINVPNEIKNRTRLFLDSVASGKSKGLASYRPQEKTSRTMTAEALLCRQFLGLERSNPLGDEAGDYVLEELPGASQTNMYYWYYATLSLYQLQGEHWNRWNSAITRTLTGSQYRDGPLAGSWDPDPVWGNYGGRVYSTALSCLCLEVYYRFLPLYIEVAKRDPAGK